MRVLNVTDVNDAYRRALWVLLHEGVLQSSRGGDVIVLDRPVTTVYSNPRFRVLFDEQRDANPFFHLMEAVWMLAGRQDGRFLDMYVSDFSRRFSDEPDTDIAPLNGAYGYRWINHFDCNQLLLAGTMLREDPDTRRAVVAMWDSNQDLGAESKDIPCNTHVYFRRLGDAVDITVCCRSNDVVWGAYGANAVHMSVMGEVVAGLAGCQLGRYYQVSNNWHGYKDIVSKLYPPLQVDPYYQRVGALVPPMPICGDDPEQREAVARQVLDDSFMLCCDLVQHDGPLPRMPQSRWMREIVYPMAVAHQAWKRGETNIAMAALDTRHDWHVAGREWIQRRLDKRAKKVDEARGK